MSSILVIILILLLTTVQGQYDEELDEQTYLERNKEREVLLPEGKICDLCVVLDRQFVNSLFKGNKLDAERRMRDVIDYTDWVYRSVDWDGNGQPDNFGFAVGKITFDWNPFPRLSPLRYNTTEQAEKMLALFSQQDFTDCCLAVGFTNRPFKHNQAGASYIASKDLRGGMCDKIRTPPHPRSTLELSGNTLLISGIGIGGVVLQLTDLALVLIHELGHSLGVLTHDMDLSLERLECSGYLLDDEYSHEQRKFTTDDRGDFTEPPLGHYIMWGKDAQGRKSLRGNNLHFSPCSIEFVRETMANEEKTKCLRQDFTPFCGNGVLEYDEECDCGNELECLEAKCCGPRSSDLACKVIVPMKPEQCRMIIQTLRNRRIRRIGKLILSNTCALNTSFLSLFFLTIISLLINHRCL